MSGAHPIQPLTTLHPKLLTAHFRLYPHHNRLSLPSKGDPSTKIQWATRRVQMHLRVSPFMVSPSRSLWRYYASRPLAAAASAVQRTRYLLRRRACNKISSFLLVLSFFTIRDSLRSIPSRQTCRKLTHWHELQALLSIFSAWQGLNLAVSQFQSTRQLLAPTTPRQQLKHTTPCYSSRLISMRQMNILSKLRTRMMGCYWPWTILWPFKLILAVEVKTQSLEARRRAQQKEVRRLQFLVMAAQMAIKVQEVILQLLSLAAY